MDKKRENINFPLSLNTLSFATWSYTITMKAQIRQELEKEIKEELYVKLYNELYEKLRIEIYNEILEKLLSQQVVGSPKDDWELAE
mgnify:CR=1 FL=1|jgi:hypothetical protein